MELTRRSFFKLGALSGAAVTLPEWVQKALPGGVFGAAVEAVPLQGEERWLPTVCGQCPAGCGMLVRTIAGIPVGLRGNPRHPVNLGGLCPRGLASLQELYHPDRLRTPLRRTGARGAGQWQNISWDEALAAVASGLRAIAHSPHKLAVMTGPLSFPMQNLWRRFAAAFGTPHLLEVACNPGAGPVDAAAATLGTDRLAYDLEKARFVLCLGTDWLQSSPSPVEASRVYGALRRGRVGQRARIVAAGPRLSVTAAKADEWIPTQPNTEGTLALGIAYVLIDEGLYDKEFVERRTLGFADWRDERGQRRPGFRTLVMRDYAPAKVAAITGVPVESIVVLAREFAESRPAVALCDRVGLRDQLAVLALNGLVGSIGREGGLRRAATAPTSPMPPLPHAPSLAPPPPAGAMKGGNPPPDALVLVLHRANPLFELPAPDKWRQTIDRIPVIISIASFPDETSQFADIVLPESSPLEEWDATATASWQGVPVLGIAQPTVKRLHDTRHAGDVLLPLARALGEPLASAFPWQQFVDLLQERARATFDSGRGEAMGKLEAWQQEETTGEDGNWAGSGGSEEPGGSWAGGADEESGGGESWAGGGTESSPDFASFWLRASRTGGWVDRSIPARVVDPIPTPSGRFEFIAPKLRHLFRDDPSVANYRPQPGRPVYAGAQADYPLRLHLYTPLVFAGGTGAHLPSLQSVAGAHLGERRWESRAEIHPETAATLAVADGDSVWLESPAGRVRLRVKVTPRLLPGVVSVAVGLGHTAYGRWAEGIGANPAGLLTRGGDDGLGHPAWNLTRVRLTRVVPA